LLGLFFDPEDGGDMFLWNVGGKCGPLLHEESWFCDQANRTSQWSLILADHKRRVLYGPTLRDAHTPDICS
jgi:hypothetical protein